MTGARPCSRGRRVTAGTARAPRAGRLSSEAGRSCAIGQAAAAQWLTIWDDPRTSGTGAGEGAQVLARTEQRSHGFLAVAPWSIDVQSPGWPDTRGRRASGADGRVTGRQMGFSLYNILKCAILVFNALAVLHDKRVLAPSETPHRTPPWGRDLSVAFRQDVGCHAARSARGALPQWGAAGRYWATGGVAPSRPLPTGSTRSGRCWRTPGSSSVSSRATVRGAPARSIWPSRRGMSFRATCCVAPRFRRAAGHRELRDHCFRAAFRRWRVASRAAVACVPRESEPIRFRARSFRHSRDMSARARCPRLTWEPPGSTSARGGLTTSRSGRPACRSRTWPRRRPRPPARSPG